MDSEPVAPPAAGARARRPAGKRSRLARAGIAALALLLGAAALLAALAFWLLATENGARYVFARIADASAGAIRAEGVRGSLAGELRAESLSWQSEGRTVTARDARLDWQPSALIERRLHLSALRIGRLDIVNNLQRTPQPATLPRSLKLPLKLQIDSLQIDGGSIAWGPLNLIELGAFGMRLDYDGMRYRAELDRLALRSKAGAGPVAGNLRGRLALQDSRPFALEGELATGGEGSVGERLIAARGRIDLHGSLEELRAAVDLALNEAGAGGQSRSLGQAAGQAMLRPFSERPLGTADVQAHALDLAALAPGLPRSRIEARLTVDAGGAGTLALSNAEPGPIDRRQLPLSSLQLAFRQQGGGFDFDRIRAALGSPAEPAGGIEGSGRYADGALSLSLSTAALDLRRIDTRLRATQLAGTAELRHANGRQEATVALAEPLRALLPPQAPAKRGRAAQRRAPANSAPASALTLNAHAILADRRLAIERAELRAGAGLLRASGEVQLADSGRFRLQGSLDRFSPQDIGDFPQLPTMSLNAEFSLQGQRAPALQGDLSFRIVDSTVGGSPLAGAGSAQLRGERIAIPNLLLDAGDNHLRLQGSLAERDSTLSFALDAPRLDQLGAGVGGAVEASGTARGTLAAPALAAEWKATRLTLPGQVRIESLQGKADIGFDRNRPFALNAATIDASAQGLQSGAQRLGTLAAKLRFSPQPDAPLALNVTAQGAAAGGWRADRITLTADGTTARHTLSAALAEPEQNWTLQASGGLRDPGRDARWEGSIDRLEAGGRLAARLAAPAPLSVSRQRLQLDSFRFEGEAIALTIEQLVRDGASGGTMSRGRLDRLRLAPFVKFAGPQPMLSTDLELEGDWNLALAETASGQARLRRRAGDVEMRGAAPVTLGLSTLEASATAAGGRLSLRLAAEGERLGRIAADAGVSLVHGDKGFSLATDAPLTGSAHIDLPSIAWTGQLASPTLITEGRLRSDVSLSGTVADPQLAGRIDGSGLRLHFTDTGVDLRQGALDSAFAGSALQIRSLSFQQDDGRLLLAGPIDFAGGTPSAALTLNAERYPVLNRSDRRLIVSGESQLALSEKRLQVNGAFTVDSGAIDIGQREAPHLSEDVVVVGREKKSEARSATLPAAAIDVSVALSRGESGGVTLRGRGIDALLRGQLRIRNGPGGTLQAQGTVNVAKGTYKAYGRELAIEHGVLRFTGAINNPALDILAMRRNQEVEAGVSVGGTALAPRVTLVSEPTVPDTEKLAWLVLGHGLNATGTNAATGASSSDNELAVLQAAATSLLSEGAASGVQSKIASTFGLDTLSLSKSQDTLQQRIVTVGKQVSSRLYVSYQQGLETAASAVLLRYTLGRRLTVEAEAGSRSVISLFYNITFD